MSLLNKRKEVIFLLLILAVAIFFRLYQLAEIPPGLYPDVAINGNDALTALRTGHFKVFYPENNGREGLFINLIALSFALFGASIWAIKIVPAIVGTLTVLGLYLLTKELFHKKSIALLSSFFLAISFWHVNFSRLGFRAIMVPFFLVWSFYFLFKGLLQKKEDRCFLEPFEGRTGTVLAKPESEPFAGAENSRWEFSAFPKNTYLRLFWLVLAGIFFGLGFHTYIAFRIAPLILIPILLSTFIGYWPRFKMLWHQHLPFNKLFKQIYLKDGWWKWDVFFAAAILIALPIGIYYLQHPTDFMGRTDQVSVLSSSQPNKELFISAIKTVGQFVAVGDFNWRHNIPGSPQIFWPLIPFFLLGLIYSFIQIFKRQNYQQKNYFLLNVYFLLLVWWLAMLLPAILTNEGLPHSLRSIGAIPPTYIFIGLGTYLFLKIIKLKIKNYRTLFALNCLLIIAALFLVGAEYYRYFILWGQNPETRNAFSGKLVNEAKYLNSLPPQIQKYVLVNENGVPVPYPDGLAMPAQTVIFLTQETPNIKYLMPDKESQTFLSAGPLVILPLNPDKELLLQIQQKIPKSEIEKIDDFLILKTNTQHER